MNIIRSGKFPDRFKRLAALLAVTILAASSGCGGSESGVSQPGGISSADSTSESDLRSSYSEVSDSSDAYSEPPRTDDTPHSADSGGETSGSADSETGDLPSDTEDSTGSAGSESSTSEVQSGFSTSSSESEPPVPPEPPPKVVVPEIVAPSSPGTNAVVAENGTLDYSNASQGYISARYTGGSAKVKLRIISGDKKYDHDVDANGKTEYFPLSFGSGEYTAILFEQISGTDYGFVINQTFDVRLSSPVSPFLCPNRYVDYGQSSNSVYKAAELCAGKTDVIGKIAAVFVWVTENVSYDNELAAAVKSGYVPNPDNTLSRKKGICFDYASLMAAMLRSQSVPTRLVVGYASPNIYHAWNEVYTEETGWITPELLLKNSGYNLVDATFYASAGNKPQISEYISNGGNYSAVYYY